MAQRFPASPILLLLCLWSVGCTDDETPTVFEPFPEFETVVFDTLGRQLGQTALVDMDRDGDLDWIAGQARNSGGELWWWENRLPDGWQRHLIGTGDTDVGSAPHDVDGDGDVDVLAGRILFLNQGPREDPVFSAHVVGTIYSHDTEFADINGDGSIDALANSDQSGLFWYEIPADPTRQWTEHVIATADMHTIHGGPSPRPVGDLDMDGDVDVVTGQGWYENVDGAGLSWRFRDNLDFGSHHRYGLAVRTWVGDLDEDGDPDVVQSEADHPDGRVAWFENDGTGEWTRHIIKEAGEGIDFHALSVDDFDLDGDLDVFSCAGPLTSGSERPNFVWEHVTAYDGYPAGRRWIEHRVADQPCHESEAGDIDGDGDVDIVAKPWRANGEHYFLRNLLRASAGSPTDGAPGS